MTTFDASEVRALSVDMSRAAGRVQAQVVPIVFRGAMQIKKQMQAEMSGSTHFKGTAAAIDFEMTDAGTTVEAEIGPKVGSGESGGLGSIAYFGNSRGGGTVPDPQGALDAEAKNVVKAIGDLAAGLI